MKSIIERISFLRVAKNEADAKRDNIRTKTINNWRGKELVLRIFNIDSDFLMYRIDNSRTIRQQLKYLRNHPDLKDDFFSDPESMLVQKAQEEILLDMIKLSGSDFTDDLRQRGQEDAAIVTFDGYIVNGNRRVAALRSINSQHISVVVLPEDTLKKDIFELEQELQLSREFREDYHWINELKNISIGRRTWNFSEEHLAKRLRLKSGDVRAKLRMMDLVESFLNWKGLRGAYDYEKLDDAEEIFFQLEKATRQPKYLNDVLRRQQLEFAVFNLVEERPKEGRLYVHVMALIKNFDQIYENMKNKKTPDNTSGQEPSDMNSGNDGTEILKSLGTGTPEIIDVFGSVEKAPELAEELFDTILSEKSKNQEQKDSEATYEAVSGALRDLQSSVIDDKTKKLESIKSKLDSILTITNALIAQASEELNRRS